MTNLVKSDIFIEYSENENEEKKCFKISESEYLKVINQLQNNSKKVIEVPDSKDLIIERKKNNYLLRNKKKGIKIYTLFGKPKKISFVKNNVKYTYSIIYKEKIEQIIKKYGLINPHFKYNNKSISLTDHINTFLNNSNITEIYEKSYENHEISESWFKDFFIRNVNSIPEPELKELNQSCVTQNYELKQLNLLDYLYDPWRYFDFINILNNKKINYVFPSFKTEKFEDFINLRRYFSNTRQKIYNKKYHEVYSSPVLYTAGGLGIGKTISILYLSSYLSNKIYFNYEKLNEMDFQNVIDLFLGESLFAFHKTDYQSYLNFKKNIMKDTYEIENDIFCLLFLFLKHYDNNISKGMILYFIIDDYSVSKDKNDYLEKFIENIKVYNNYRVIVNYSLKDIEDKKYVLNKLTDEEKTFLYLNDLGNSYEELEFKDERIKKVLKNFNYSPYYYFKYAELFKDKNKKSEDIKEFIKKRITKKFKKIKKIGYILSVIPWINLIEDENVIIELISKLPLEFFTIKKEKANSQFTIKMIIKPINETLEKIINDFIEEALSKLIISEFNKIIDNNIIQGIVYENYITRKISNTKKFGKREYEIREVSEIINFNYSKRLENNKNYCFCQNNFSGKAYDIMFLIENRLIFGQISISKTLIEMKAVIETFVNTSRDIKKRIIKLGYDVETCELFFIFKSDSPSIIQAKKNYIPFIIFEPKENEIYLDNQQDEIDSFPKIYNSKYEFLSNLNFIMNYYDLRSNILSHCNIEDYKNNGEENMTFQSIEKKIEINKIFLLNKFQISFAHLKKTSNVSFVADNYIIIPISYNKTQDFIIYKIKAENFVKLISKEERKKEILSNEYDKVILGKIKISDNHSKSETKLLTQKRKRNILKKNLKK